MEKILETLAGEKAAHEALQESEVAKRVSIEADVAGKMEGHHRARAVQRAEARQQLQKKAQAQVRAGCAGSSSARAVSLTVWGTNGSFSAIRVCWLGLNLAV